MDGELRSSEPPRSGDDFRRQMLAKVPRWYSPWGHLGATLGVGVVTLSVALGRLDGPSLWELLTVPSAFVFANLVEWFAHRYLMHQRRFPLAVLYDRHTPEHHRVFRYDDMAIEEPRELKLVLIPAMGVLGMVLLAAPVALLVGHLLSWNVGWLFLATSGVYVVGYELSHLAYHLPERSLVYRLPFVRALREHHACHHIPALMQRHNFNVTIPLGDLLFGTFASAEVVERAVQKQRQRSACEG